MAPKIYTINFMGDTMLGRLIDQLFPQHVHCPEEAQIIQSFRSSNRAFPTPYEPTTPWGSTLPLLQSADLNILNLETSATTHAIKWPNKVFNYRMHPANIAALNAAGIHYAGLANNHTLDFCEEGLVETVRTVKEARIAFAGGGESRQEAQRPAVLKLPSSKDQDRDHEICVWAAADHPSDWSKISTFHFIDYTLHTRTRLKALLNSSTSTESGKSSALRIFSIHWGPNYSWQPAKEIRDLAHFLIDECDIDIIHGHSSHHVQGVEKYKNKLIIYGCGDFVDDYAVVSGGWRNDLSAIWRVKVREEEAGEGGGSVRLKVKGLEVFPTVIEGLRVRRLETSEADADWVCKKIKDLSSSLGTEVEIDEQQGTVKLDFD